MKRSRYLLITVIVVFIAYCALDAGYSYWTDSVTISGNARYTHSIELIRIDAVVEEVEAAKEEQQADDESRGDESYPDNGINDIVLENNAPAHKTDDKPADDIDNDKQDTMEGGPGGTAGEISSDDEPAGELFPDNPPSDGIATDWETAVTSANSAIEPVADPAEAGKASASPDEAGADNDSLLKSVSGESDAFLHQPQDTASEMDEGSAQKGLDTEADRGSSFDTGQVTADDLQGSNLQADKALAEENLQE